MERYIDASIKGDSKEQMILEEEIAKEQRLFIQLVRLTDIWERFIISQNNIFMC